MKDTRLIMGMPITVDIVDSAVDGRDLETVFSYFIYVDEKFSIYKPTSEISLINKGGLNRGDYSRDMQEIFNLSEKTYADTGGFFNIKIRDKYDPSGLVKGWAIYNAAKLLKKSGFKNFYINAGGDIQTSGHNALGKKWTIGIRNPFKRNEIVKVITLNDGGVATSGSYIRGQHILNPFDEKQRVNEIVSLTVIGPNIYEADRFATSAYAMGRKGICFIEKLRNLEGYMIDNKGMATFTSGFGNYLVRHD